MNRLITIVLASIMVLMILANPAVAQQAKYYPVGMGGGGAMYSPASSPHNPKLMFVSCDMSGFYRSEDGGKSWQIIDFRQTKSNTKCPPVFHPTKANVIYFSGKVSNDFGKTWKPIVNPAPWRGRIQRMGIDPENGSIIIVGLADGAWISVDYGRTWSRCAGVKGTVVGIAPLQSILVIGTDQGIWRSTDRGKTWTDSTQGLPWRGIRGLSGGQGLLRLRFSFPVLYCTIPSRNQNGKFAGGIYRSDDGGQTWKSAMGKGLNTQLGKVDEWGSGDIPQYNRIQAGLTKPNVVYVTCTGTGYWPPHHNTVYRTDNGGKTWQSVQSFDLRFAKAKTPDYKGTLDMNFVHGWIPFTVGPGWGGMPGRNGIHVNRGNPNIVMASNGGELFVTTDGGKKWRQIYTKYSPGQNPPGPKHKENPGRWQSIGLEVTTTWNYRIDPHDHNRHFICYTDIGLIRSEDAGKTWTDSNAGTPWGGNTYDIVFDPARKGRVWAAQSKVHDIPHWTYIHEEVKGPGGICVSNDGGKSWKLSSKGLPDAPCTSVIMDPKSPVGNRTLYCVLYDHGVYKSTDDGKSWKPMNKGINLKRNSHSWLIKIHPNGTLYCGVTGMRGPGRGNTYTRPGALYKSTDGGKNWTNILASIDLYWPGEWAVHPTDPDIVYLAVHTATRRENGGVYRTTDGGKTWKRFLNNQSFRGKGGPNWATPLMLTMDPKDPDTLYMGTSGHGLWISRDRAETWKQHEGLPFGNIHRLTFDPDKPDKVYFTTFGAGVWVGPKP